MYMYSVYIVKYVCLYSCMRVSMSVTESMGVCGCNYTWQKAQNRRVEFHIQGRDSEKGMYLYIRTHAYIKIHTVMILTCVRILCPWSRLWKGYVYMYTKTRIYTWEYIQLWYVCVLEFHVQGSDSDVVCICNLVCGEQNSKIKWIHM